MTYQEPKDYELLQSFLLDLNAGEILIPELQHPFYPSEEEVLLYIRNLYHHPRLNPFILQQKGGSPDTLIKGQLEAIMLLAVFFGKEILTPEYEKKKITISFNLKTEEFRIQTPETASSPEWIADISVAFNPWICEICFAIDTYGDTLSGKERDHIDKLFALRGVRIGVRRVTKG